MKFSQTIKSEATPEWRFYYINYSKLRKIIESYQENAPKSEILKKDCPLGIELGKEFFASIQSELSKVNSFFELRIKEAERIFDDIKREIGSIWIALQNSVASLKEGDAAEQFEATDYARTAFLEELIDYESIKSVRKKNKKLDNSYKSVELATSEFYLYLNHVKQFQILNFSGFRKIIKKFDKVFQTLDGENFRKLYVETSPFFVNKAPDSFTLDIEDIYVKMFANGNRSSGMKKLRVPTKSVDKKDVDIPSFSFGILVSANILLFSLLIYCAIYIKQPPFNQTHVMMLAGQLMIILYVIGFGINLYGWSRSSVNHVLVFEIDPRNHINFIQCFLAGFLMLAIWFSSVFAYITLERFKSFLPYISLISFLIFIFIFANPFGFFFRSSRFWTARIIITNFITPFISVRFADFWLYDQFCSLSEALVSVFAYTPCIFIVTVFNQHDMFCLETKMAFSSIVRCFPYYVRFMQCLRRFYDFYCAKRIDFAHIFNAIKYFSSIIVIILTVVAASIKENETALFWTCLVARFLLVTYLLFWDLWIDWSFFGTPNQLKSCRLGWSLRSNIMYSSRFVYYLAMVQNIIVRYVSILPTILNKTISDPDKHKITLTYIGIAVNILEIFRRVIWNFFRLENEHLNNVGRYRIVRDIPILRSKSQPSPNLAVVELNRSESSEILNPSEHSLSVPSLPQTL